MKMGSTSASGFELGPQNRRFPMPQALQAQAQAPSGSPGSPTTRSKRLGRLSAGLVGLVEL